MDIPHSFVIVDANEKKVSKLPSILEDLSKHPQMKNGLHMINDERDFTTLHIKKGECCNEISTVWNYQTGVIMNVTWQCSAVQIQHTPYVLPEGQT